MCLLHFKPHHTAILANYAPFLVNYAPFLPVDLPFKQLFVLQKVLETPNLTLRGYGKIFAFNCSDRGWLI
jgi:hypothetical protein